MRDFHRERYANETAAGAIETDAATVCDVLFEVEGAILARTVLSDF